MTIEHPTLTGIKMDFTDFLTCYIHFRDYVYLILIENIFQDIRLFQLDF